MTPEHEEAFPYGEAVRLAEKHEARRISDYYTDGTVYAFTREQLADLIAEVRRQAMEECLLVCKEADYFGDVYDVIRARIPVNGKQVPLEGKEEV